MHSRALLVGKLAGFFKPLWVKIPRSGAHSELPAGKVHRVRAVVQRHGKALGISGRRKKLRLLIHSSALQ